MAPDVDDGLAAIRIAEVLRVSALDVPDLPPIWIRNAMIYLKVQQLQHDRAVKAARKRARTANARTSRP